MSTATVTQEATVTHINSIFDNACLLSVGRAWPSLTKALDKQFITVNNADKSRLHGSKDLYNSEELKKLFNLEAQLDLKLRLYCIPFPLKTGVYILPNTLWPEVKQVLIDHSNARQPYINTFVQKYTDIVAASQTALGPSFNPADYSTPEAVGQEFRFEWHILEMNVAGQLRAIDQEAFESEQQKMQEVWQEAGQAATQLLTAQMKGMVDHLVDRLSTPEDGKKKIFRNSVLDPINEFIKTFEPRNLNNSAELKQLVEDAKNLINGVSPEDLRSNEALKSSVQQGFAQMKVVLDQMMINEPVRGITLSE